jgi:hypothetical protein
MWEMDKASLLRVALTQQSTEKRDNLLSKMDQELNRVGIGDILRKKGRIMTMYGNK